MADVIMKTSVPQQDPEDADAIFSKYVLTELRQFNDERTKTILKHRIQGIIFDAKMGMFSDCAQPQPQAQ